MEKVEEFNRNNRWKKRGINLLPMIYPIEYPPFRYNILIAILHDGGSIAVSHGGIEMGQGINTKVILFLIFKSDMFLVKNDFLLGDASCSKGTWSGFIFGFHQADQCVDQR